MKHATFASQTAGASRRFSPQGAPRKPRDIFRRLPTLVIDRNVPGAQEHLNDWLHNFRQSKRPLRLATGPDKRFTVAMASPTWQPVIISDDSLASVLGVITASMTEVQATAELSLSDVLLETHLAEPEKQQVEAWRNGGRAPETSQVLYQADSGVVPILHSRGVNDGLLSGRAVHALILDIRDRLLERYAIAPPVRTGSLDSSDLTAAIAASSGSAGPARVEHSVQAVVMLGDRGVGAITSTYVLPHDGASLLMHVTLLVTSEGAGLCPDTFEVTGTTIWWQGATRASMNAVIADIKDVVDKAAGLGQEQEEEFQGDMAVSRELVTEYVAHQIKRAVADAKLIEQLDAGVRAAVAENNEAATALTKATKRWSDKESDLQATLEAVRASVERERIRRAAVEKELSALKAASVRPAPEPPRPDVSPRVLADLRANAEHQRSLAEDYADELVATRQELHLVLAQRDAYAALLTPAAASSVAPVAYPSSLTELGGWANLQLGERVVVLPRALRSARKSTFGDPALVCRTLEALRDYYWPMRFDGSSKARARWEQFLRDERLRCGLVGEAATAHLTKESYTVSWRGKRLAMDLHVQGHSGRDEVRQFRLYFLADEATRTVVCGHLPGHLQNSLS